MIAQSIYFAVLFDSFFIKIYSGSNLLSIFLNPTIFLGSLTSENLPDPGISLYFLKLDLVSKKLIVRRRNSLYIVARIK